jgi:hypothetical protein
MQQGGNHVLSYRSKITPSISGHQTWSFLRPAVKFICLWENKHSHNRHRKTASESTESAVTLILNIWRIYLLCLSMSWCHCHVPDFTVHFFGALYCVLHL